MSDPVVHVIDDDEAVRQSLAFLLASSGFAVRIYESAQAFLDAAAVSQLGCVLTDIRMPGMSGLDLQRELVARRIALPLIVMTGHGDVALAVEAMKAGAVDFIEKPFSEEVILKAIRTGLDRFERDMVQHGAASAVEARLKTLTPREREVLEGLIEGLPNKTIAYDLAISARTVEVHRANLMTKMAASSLPELVRMVLLSRAPSH
ncbi:response regulator FixJ [Acidocella sp.]|uniref:response regulator FixJ n=1 Tax=Acidocella sp. TaxID=50710 RepID=UPI002628803D|nr:response regulator FixJ [Acidocella sp.]